MKQRCKRCIRLGYLLLVGYLASCTLAEVEERTPSPTGGETVEAQFTIQVKSEENGFTKAGGDSLQTRAASAMTDVEERAIKTLWIGQYVNGALQNAGMTGSYISSVDLTLIKVLLKSSLEQSTVYLIANAGDLGTPTEADLKTKIKSYGSDGASVETNVKKDGLVMIGTWKGVASSSSSTGAPFEKTVQVERLVSKICFRYSFASVSGFTFTPTSLTLRHVPNGSQYLEPDGQLASGISYVDIPASSFGGGVEYWYIPENKAGRGVEAPEKEKTGAGRTNATYIELIGNAVQDGVTYTGVSFKYYPGSDSSDYNLRRNQSYDVVLTIKGIDFADKRMTVGNIPDPSLPAGQLNAEANSEATIQITEQPGKEWSFTKESWYSVTGTGVAINGNTVKGKGPVLLTALALTPNPQETERSHTFSVQGKTITLRQVAASLIRREPSTEYVSFDASAISSTIGIRATAGLPLSYTLEPNQSWISFSGLSGESTGIDQYMSLALSLNTSSSNRGVRLNIRAGNTISPYGPGTTVAITQAGAILNVSNTSVQAAASTSNYADITGTSGLSWQASTVTSWLKLNGLSGKMNSSGLGSIGFDVTATNPNASTRTGTITVKAGDAISGSDANLTKSITVTQVASELTTPASVSIEATTDYAQFTFTATKGLEYTASTSTSWLTIARGSGSGTTGSGAITIGFNASLNTSNARNGTITVKAGNITKSVTVIQNGTSFSVSPTSLTIPASGGTASTTVTATSGLGWTVSRTSGSTEITANVSSSSGNKTVTFSASRNTSASRSATFRIVDDMAARSYMVTITQPKAVTLSEETGTEYYFNNAEKFCADLTENNTTWMLPTLEQMQQSGITSGYYWTSTTSGEYAYVFAPEIPDGYLKVAILNGRNYYTVRCIRVD